MLLWKLLLETAVLIFLFVAAGECLGAVVNRKKIRQEKGGTWKK